MALHVVLDPVQRKEHLKNLLHLEGLSHVEENPHAAYCPISLTSVVDPLRSYIQHRQKLLLEKVLAIAGITGYDPATAPFSPDKGLTHTPQEVYATDSCHLLSARYFVGHYLFPSTGCGVEMEKAKLFNRIPVLLLDRKIRVSRMMPPRTIYLAYDDFEKQIDDFVKVFEFLKEFEPGLGFTEKIPVLLGFKKDGTVVDLEHTVYKKFPHLKYTYDGNTPLIKLWCTNSELFVEHGEFDGKSRVFKPH